METIKEIYKIGNGPSSSHTIGPKKAAEYVLDKYQDLDFVDVYLYGSLALTGKGHLTDYIIYETLKDKCKVIFDYDLKVEHPNTLKFVVYKNNKVIGEEIVYSIGGGYIKIKGQEETSYLDIYKETTFDQVKDYISKNNMTLSEYIYFKEDDSFKDYLDLVYNTMLNSINNGLEKEGYLPGKLKVKRKAKDLYHEKKVFESPQAQNIRLIASYAFAVGEENASGGLIVTAPTCGACGVVPAVLKYLKDNNIPYQNLIDGLAVAGLVGNLIKENASISGAECGCQAEIGSACSMAAALYCYATNTSLAQLEVAIEMALEHNLGLTCDPVEGFVQIPCIERNAVAALRALDVSIIASSFSNNETKVSFDEVTKTMYETGKSLSSEYRETSMGGLAKILKKN